MKPHINWLNNSLMMAIASLMPLLTMAMPSSKAPHRIEQSTLEKYFSSHPSIQPTLPPIHHSNYNAPITIRNRTVKAAMDLDLSIFHAPIKLSDLTTNKPINLKGSRVNQNITLKHLTFDDSLNASWLWN